jgi:hypothetical protein
MAIEFTVKRFSKPGKGFPQVPQLDDAGVAQVDSDGKPIIGNEQYTCNQLTDDSVSSDSVEHFIEDVLASVNGEVKLAAEMFREGWNRSTRLSAAGLDEYQKAAKGVIKLNLPWTKGLTVDQVADKLKAMNG